MSVKIGSTLSFLGLIQKPQGDPVSQETVKNCRHEDILTQIIQLFQMEGHNAKKDAVKKKTPKLVTRGIPIISLLKFRVYLRTYMHED